jgi:hypothetical protein
MLRRLWEALAGLVEDINGLRAELRTVRDGLSAISTALPPPPADVTPAILAPPADSKEGGSNGAPRRRTSAAR